MKSVTKLGRASASSSGPANGAPLTPAEMAGNMENMKRRYREALEAQSQQISALQVCRPP